MTLPLPVRENSFCSWLKNFIRTPREARGSAPEGGRAPRTLPPTAFRLRFLAFRKSLTL